jgi:O-antigen/teichoic acid export membrane protein
MTQIKIDREFDVTGKKLLGSIATLFSGSTIAQAVTALASLLTARHLEPELFGLYSASFVLASVTAIVYNLGMDLWLLREGGRKHSMLGEMAAGILVIKLIGGIPWLFALFTIAPLISPDTYPYGLILWAGAAVLIDSLFTTTTYIFKARLRNRLAVVLEVGCDLLWFGGVILLIIGGNINPMSFAQIRAFALLPGLLLAVILIQKSENLHLSFNMMRAAIRNAPPYALSDLLASAAARLDIIIVSLALGSFAVGLYAPAVNLLNAAFIAPAAVYVVLVPYLSNAFAYNFERAVVISKRAIAGLLGLGLLLSAGFALASPLIIYILGESYAGSLNLLYILSFILFFKSGSFGMATILVATGNQKKRSGAQAAAVGFNIVANLLVVGTYGITGVAAVYLATEIILFISYTYLVMRERCITVPVLQDQKLL